MSEDHGIYGLEVPPTPPAQDLESGAPSERTAGKHERDSSVPELSVSRTCDVSVPLTCSSLDASRFCNNMPYTGP